MYIWIFFCTFAANFDLMMDRKVLFVLFFCSIALVSYAQAYHTINVLPADHITSSNDASISVVSVSPVEGERFTYLVNFRDNQNTNRAVERYSTSFQFSFYYKGKRVSDYFYGNSSENYNFSQKAFIWPDAVPKGYEQYVSVRVGREPIHTGNQDRRKDD